MHAPEERGILVRYQVTPQLADIRKEVYDKHIKEGLTHEEIKRKYLDQFLARFKK